MAFPFERAAPHPFADLLELECGGLQQRLALVGTEPREIAVTTGDQPFPGIIGMAELEQVAPIKEPEL
jgi:hypothetical protein